MAMRSYYRGCARTTALGFPWGGRPRRGFVETGPWGRGGATAIRWLRARRGSAARPWLRARARPDPSCAAPSEPKERPACAGFRPRGVCYHETHPQSPCRRKRYDHHQRDTARRPRAPDHLRGIPELLRRPGGRPGQRVHSHWQPRRRGRLPLRAAAGLQSQRRQAPSAPHLLRGMPGRRGRPRARHERGGGRGALPHGGPDP